MSIDDPPQPTRRKAHQQTTALSDLWKEPTWTRDPYLDSMRGLIVEGSMIIFEREENRFPTTIGRAPYIDKHGALTLVPENINHPPTTIRKANPYFEEDGTLTTVLEMPPLGDKYARLQEVLWGPGTEARAACLLIDRAPAMKHDVWNAVERALSDMPPHPCHTSSVITILDRAVLAERGSWRRLEVLEPAQTLEAAAALDIEVILASFCCLAGVTACGRDPIKAVGELHYSLSDDMAVLRRIHRRLRMLSGTSETASAGKLPMYAEAIVQEQLDRFKKTWTTIVEQLSPGRLANEMAFYANTMEDLVNEDGRYAMAGVSSDLSLVKKSPMVSTDCGQSAVGMATAISGARWT